MSKHRLVKFIRKNIDDQHTQTDEYDPEIRGYETRGPGEKITQKITSEVRTKTKKAQTIQMCPNMGQAMREETESVKENNTFDLTSLLEDRSAVGRKWVHALKGIYEQRQIFKARDISTNF